MHAKHISCQGHRSQPDARVSSHAVYAGIDTDRLSRDAACTRLGQLPPGCFKQEFAAVIGFMSPSPPTATLFPNPAHLTHHHPPDARYHAATLHLKSHQRGGVVDAEAAANGSHVRSINPLGACIVLRCCAAQHSIAQHNATLRTVSLDTLEVSAGWRCSPLLAQTPHTCLRRPWGCLIPTA